MILKDIKLAGIDLDGTLLCDNKTLSEKTRAAIVDAKGRNIHIVPVTGRPFLGMPSFIKEIDEIEYYICSNGAKIISAKDEKELFSFSLSNEKSREIIDFLDNFDCMYEPFCGGIGYMEQRSFDYYKEKFTGTPIGDYIFSSRRLTDSIRSLFNDESVEADEIFINCKNEKTRESLINASSSIRDIQLCSLGDSFLEITKKGTDKGAALGVICNYLGIDPKNSIVFGDGENDLLFFKKAGVSVAMENAFPVVKEAADIITKSNNDDGVAEILNLL